MFSGKGEKKPMVSASKLVTHGAWPGVFVGKNPYGVVILHQEDARVAMSMEQAREVAKIILQSIV